MNFVFAWPVGRDPSQNAGVNQWAARHVFFWAATVGGAVLGGGVALMVTLLPKPTAAMAVGVILLAALFELLRRMGPFPEWRRQVRRQALLGDERRAAARFGFRMGSAVSIYLNHPVFYGWIALAWASHMQSWQIIVGVTVFGVVRGIAPTVFYMLAAVGDGESAMERQRWILSNAFDRWTRGSLLVWSTGAVVVAL